jgi:hypothetical protein
MESKTTTGILKLEDAPIDTLCNSQERLVESEFSHSNTAFIIVVYGKNLSDSSTLRSLRRYRNLLSSASILIWNNGPTGITEACHEFLEPLRAVVPVMLFECLENRPLSWIYNDGISRLPAKAFIILDDDTHLTADYLRWSLSSTAYISVPILISAGHEVSPRVAGTFQTPPYKTMANVIAAGSGVRISHTAARLLQSAFGNVFDERFALYGADSSLFYRLKKLMLCDKIELGPRLEHSSSLTDPMSRTTRFRRMERGYDLGLQVRHYPSFYVAKRLVQETVLAMFGKSRLAVACAWSGLLRGRHPKCRHQKR